MKDGTTIRPSLPVVCHLSMGDIAGIQHAGLGNLEAGSIQSDNLNLHVHRDQLKSGSCVRQVSPS